MLDLKYWTIEVPYLPTIPGKDIGKQIAGRAPASSTFPSLGSLEGLGFRVLRVLRFLFRV